MNIEYYMAAWLILSGVAFALLIVKAEQFPFTKTAYWRFLLQPWKSITFLMALIPMIYIAPYSGDPTWDYVDASFMSILTFVTAPWTVGILLRFFRQQASFVQLYVALCLWMFSVSWSYDGYIYLRDGFYPPTWGPNIILSTTLYLPAGLMWSLAWSQEKKAHFAFSTAEWYETAPSSQNTAKVLIWALPFILLAIGILLPFAWDYLKSLI